jgi:hypothetical protein
MSALSNITARGGDNRDEAAREAEADEEYRIRHGRRRPPPPPPPPPPSSPTTLAVQRIGGITAGILIMVNDKLNDLYSNYYIDDTHFIGYETYNDLILKKKKKETEKERLTEEKKKLTSDKEKSTIKMLYKSVVNYKNQNAIKKQIKEIEKQIEEIEQQIDIVKEGVNNVINFLKILLEKYLKSLVDFYNDYNNYILLNSVSLSYILDQKDSSDSRKLIELRDSGDLKEYLHSLIIILFRLFMLTEDFINISQSNMPQDINKRKHDAYDLSMFNDFNDFKTELDKYVIIFQHTYKVLFVYKDKIEHGLKYDPPQQLLPQPERLPPPELLPPPSAAASVSSSVSLTDETDETDETDIELINEIKRKSLISEINRLGETTNSDIPDLTGLSDSKLLELLEILKTIESVTAGGQYRGKKKSKKSKKLQCKKLKNIIKK